MPRPEKIQAVADIKERLEQAEAVFLTEYRGLSVKEAQNLRNSLRAAGAEYKVVKMTLARLAANDAGIDGLDQYLSGPTALAFASQNPVSTAKALKEFANAHEALTLKAGYMAGSILTPEEISRLADIESREVLLGRIAGGFKAPLFQAASMFASFNREAASLFSQLIDKKESGETPAGETTPADDDSAEPVAAEAEEE